MSEISFSRLCSMIDTLTLDELRKLPNAENAEAAGVYFLWLRDELQYIGQSRNVCNRLTSHRLDFDRATFIAFESKPYYDDRNELAKLQRALIECEATYVNAYRTPFNNWPHKITSVERARMS